MDIRSIKIEPKDGTLKLAPVGDIQYGAESVEHDKLDRHIDFGVEHDWYFLGMGDYLDHFSPSNRRALVAARGSLYDSARELLDEAVDNRIHELASFLRAPKGGDGSRWLGLIQGDHAWEFENGEHSDERLAKVLGAPFFGTSVLLNIKVPGCPIPLRVFATHGAGASINATGKTLHLERLVRAFEADIYLMGHSHLKYGVPLDRFETVTKGNKSWLVNRTKIIGITGSFMSGYVKGKKGTYVEEKALTPVPTGGLLIEAKPVKEEWGWRWDMFVTA